MKTKLLSLSLLLSTLGLLAQTPRMSLYEEFTGENCGPCAGTNPGLNALLTFSNNPTKIIPIKWQVPIPSAPTTTWSLYQTNHTEIDYRWKTGPGNYGYNPAINSAPSSKIDGQEATVFGASSSHPTDLTSGVIATAQSYTSAFSITLNRAWDATCSSVNLTVSIVATANFNSVGALKLRTVMIERLIQFPTAPGSNGEKNFEDVVIKSFPTIQNGVAMASAWTIGQTQTFTLNCPIPTYVRKKSEIALVCFIQDDSNQKVAQAARAEKVPIPVEALAALDAKVNATCAGTISPQVTIRNDGVSAITNLTINPFTDGVARTSTSWSGNLAAGASTTILLNTINTATTSGVHTFSFNVDINVPSYNLTYTANKVNYLVATVYQGASVTEPFSFATYPPANWVVSNSNAGTSWSRAVNAGGFNIVPLASTKYDFFNNSVIGDVDELFLPPSDLSGSNTPVLTFDLAYAQRTSNSNDQLDVLVSDDCGANWSNVYSKAGNNLATAFATASSYVPNLADSTEWRTETVLLTGFNKPEVLVKFIATNDNGNNMYIDNVNLSHSEPVGILKQNSRATTFELFPNPTSGNFNLSITSSIVSKGKMTVINNLGQVILQKEIAVSSGTTNLLIDATDFNIGLYHVNFLMNNQSSNKKIIISK